jgi:hypothetical protein
LRSDWESVVLPITPPRQTQTAGVDDPLRAVLAIGPHHWIRWKQSKYGECTTDQVADWSTSGMPLLPPAGTFTVPSASSLPARAATTANQHRNAKRVVASPPTSRQTVPTPLMVKLELLIIRSTG